MSPGRNPAVPHNAQVLLQRSQITVRAERAQSIAIPCQLRRSLDAGRLDVYE